MLGLGSGDCGEFTFIDLLAIAGFFVGLQNLDLNIDQNDMDAQTREISERANNLVQSALSEIHSHLQIQDEKIDKILEALHETDKKAV